MLPTIYRVAILGAGQLSVMAKPVGGEYLAEEISGLNHLGVERVVSLLEPSEVQDVQLEQEPSLCLEYGIGFTSFPIPDRGLPETDRAQALAEELCEEVSSGRHVVIHCRAGIGRTGILACAVLIKAGYSARGALDTVSQARGVEVPDTEEQAAWVQSLERKSI